MSKWFISGRVSGVELCRKTKCSQYDYQLFYQCNVLLLAASADCSCFFFPCGRQSARGGHVYVCVYCACYCQLNTGSRASLKKAVNGVVFG